MKAQSVAAVCLLTSLLACSSSSNTSQPTMCFGNNIMASEKSNYVFSSQMMLAPVTVASMSNLKFDWSGLRKDFLGRPLNPTQDLDLALVMLWSLPLATFQKALNEDALFTSDLIVS